MFYCTNCGTALEKSKTICQSCGFENQVIPSPYSRQQAMFRCLLAIIGLSGMERFYVGRWKSGILYLLTAGFCFIGVIIDLYKIYCGEFVDKDGLFLKE